ncbi:TetR/AcrR family transcriptional regulator [Agromyces sp. NPDC004153]
MRITRTRWLDEGLVVLAEDGPSGLRIDKLSARLGVTKGSFHHHFAGAPGFKTALLAHYEEQARAALDEAIAARSGEGTRATLASLTELATADGDGGLRRPRLDTAVRAWAQSDPEVRETQARIDAAAVGALQAAWRPLVASDAEARAAALVPYLVSLGAEVTVPPIQPGELRRVYELLLTLVPAPLHGRD